MAPLGYFEEGDIFEFIFAKPHAGIVYFDSDALGSVGDVLLHGCCMATCSPQDMLCSCS